MLSRSGAELEAHYSNALAALGTSEDMLGVVFHKARNRIQTSAKLEQLIKEFIDQHEWMSYDADLKGDAYESLEDTDNLPPPVVLAVEIAEDPESALAEIQALAESLAATSETTPS